MKKLWITDKSSKIGRIRLITVVLLIKVSFLITAFGLRVGN